MHLPAGIGIAVPPRKRLNKQSPQPRITESINRHMTPKNFTTISQGTEKENPRLFFSTAAPPQPAEKNPDYTSFPTENNNNGWNPPANHQLQLKLQTRDPGLPYEPSSRPASPNNNPPSPDAQPFRAEAPTAHIQLFHPPQNNDPYPPSQSKQGSPSSRVHTLRPLPTHPWPPFQHAPRATSNPQNTATYTPKALHRSKGHNRQQPLSPATLQHNHDSHPTPIQKKHPFKPSLMELPRLRGQLGALGFPRFLEPPFVESRRKILDTGMPTTGIVPASEGSEQSHPGLGLGAEPVAIQKLAFQGDEETFAQGIVKAVADRSCRTPHAGLAAPLTERDRGVLGALFRAMDDPLKASVAQRHLQGIQDQLRSEIVGHRPDDHPAGKDIEHTDHEQEPCPDGNICDIGHPELIRTFGRELVLDQIRSGLRPATGKGHTDALAPAYPHDPGRSHQPHYPLADDSDPLLAQIYMNPPRPLGAAALLTDGSDRLGQLLIFPSSPPRQSAAPPLVPAGGDLQQTAHRGHSMQAPLPLHEFQDFGAIEPLCRANQAPAFAKTSRSSRNCRSSLLTLTSSCLSAVAKPSSRRPSCRSGCTTHFPIVCAEASYSRASVLGLCQPPTTSISCLLNSATYRRLALRTVDFLQTHKSLRLHEIGPIPLKPPRNPAPPTSPQPAFHTSISRSKLTTRKHIKPPTTPNSHTPPNTLRRTHLIMEKDQ